MTTITFDTLKFVEKLKAAGIPEGQAKAEAEALQAVLAETLESQLSTKNDLIRVERRLDGIDAKIDRMDTRISGELTIVRMDDGTSSRRYSGADSARVFSGVKRKIIA